MYSLTFQFSKMLKKNYYCLIAGLPDLIIDGYRKALTSLQFRLELVDQLNRPDYNLLELFYRQYDNKNLLNLLLQQKFQFDILGNYTENYLKNQIVEPTDIVEYMKMLISDFKSETFDKSPLHSENRLQELFYNDILKTNNDFIKQWFVFDRDTRNILTATNCHKYGYALEKHLIPDKKNNGLYEILLKEVLKPNMLADEDRPYLKQILQLAESTINASEKEKAIDNIKWTFLDELTFFYYFTIETILSFVIKLNIIDRWNKLDSDTGKAFLERLINELEMSYSFPEEFSLIK